MEHNPYMLNMQKVLFIAHELHQRGYENLRVIPSKSPSGMSWRCFFISTTDSEKENVFASGWMERLVNNETNDAESIEELANLFEREHQSFLKKCQGENPQYLEWFSQMVSVLKKEELPYAFADYFGPTDYWQTSHGNKIYTLPNEQQYYFNY